MPDRPPSLGWAPRAALFAALLALLTDCGPARNQFAPPCPGPAILGDAADYDIYRAGGTSRGASDLTDLVLHARIVGIQGSCREGDQKNRLAVTVSVGIELNRGPAMQGRDAEVPVFVAVTEGETILDKRAVRMPVVRVESCPAGVTNQVRGGVHHPRRLPAHAGPDGANPRPLAVSRAGYAGSRSIAASIATFTSPGCASTAWSTDFSRLRNS
jgi:hypothetical protein